MSESAGLHVILDGYVLDSVVFEKERLSSLFYKLVDALEMTMLVHPQFVEVDVDPEVLRRVQETGKFEDEGGITGFCVISTSHMSIHCWPLQQFFSLDVFSCKDFDSERALDLIRQELNVVSTSKHIIPRSKPVRPPERALHTLKCFQDAVRDSVGQTPST